ncbi:hypothetical protein DRO48_01965 [Candidatus Bathyarchaeota archaeon]|nr:MAG: hypothetical protein DRO48_01965 [Candidatus Bathyarchaeota archaeon]
MSVRLTTREITLTASLAALYIATSIVPGIPIIGGQGKISPSVILVPVYALLLGPIVGPLTIFIGNLGSWLLPPGRPDPFSGLMIIPGVLGALASATAVRGRRGWIVSSGVLAVLLALWYSTWVGIGAPFYPVPHVAALLIPLAAQGRLGRWLHTDNKRMAVSAALASYVGLMADHMAGNLVFIFSIGWLLPVKLIEGWLGSMGLPSVSALFMYMLPVSIVERLSMTAAATIISAALIAALRDTGLLPEWRMETERNTKSGKAR